MKTMKILLAVLLLIAPVVPVLAQEIERASNIPMPHRGVLVSCDFKEGKLVIHQRKDLDAAQDQDLTFSVSKQTMFMYSDQEQMAVMFSGDTIEKTGGGITVYTVQEEGASRVAYVVLERQQ